MNINEIPDKILADMVRNGCYAKNTSFDDGTQLLVLAVPYGPNEDVEDLKGAMEAFQSFVADWDWHERQFQVLRAKDGQAQVFETSYESEEYDHVLNALSSWRFSGGKKG